jgi:hypothetical protein
VSRAGTIGWRWQPRAAPPEPRAVVAWGVAARRLLMRLQALDEARQAKLQATASGEALIVSADQTEALPWSEGAAYAAPCVRAPGLWLPTLHEPDLPVDLIASALQARHARQPLLLWPDPAAIVPLDRLLPASPSHLARIEAHWRGREVSP